MRPLREAAVLMAICARPPHRVLFIERAAHLRDHPGQIGLPGGSVDPADGDDRTRTALREVREELGIAATHVTIVARLPDVRQRVNTFNVSPLVGVLRETVSLPSIQPKRQRFSPFRLQRSLRRVPFFAGSRTWPTARSKRGFSIMTAGIYGV